MTDKPKKATKATPAEKKNVKSASKAAEKPAAKKTAAAAKPAVKKSPAAPAAKKAKPTAEKAPAAKPAKPAAKAKAKGADVVAIADLGPELALEEIKVLVKMGRSKGNLTDEEIQGALSDVELTDNQVEVRLQVCLYY